MIEIRRIFAFIIDLIIYMFLVLYVGAHLDLFIADINNWSEKEMFENKLWIKYVLVISIFYWIFLEIIFKQSIGKWILKLEIINYSNANIRVAILFRNLCRTTLMMSSIGILIVLIYYLVTGKTGYDQFVGTDVIIKDGDLTDTQKNWRKHFKE